ncbi:MAG: TatD family hydrolase [Planctomycetota bacterium]
MIDTHCHLTFPDFAGRVDDIVQQAAAAGVTGMITISTTSADVDSVVATASAHPHVWCTSGIHPLYVDRDPRDWDALRAAARSDKCVAWGELGLDRHYDNPPIDLQITVLAEQLAMIEAFDDSDRRMPVVVHCRKAVDELLPILRSSNIAGDRFVFHCFTETEEMARKVLDFGAMLSFTGVVTYKNAPEVRGSASLVPVDRMMVETDAPFLSPVPVRGERPCVPAYSMHTARFLATLKDLPVPDFLREVDNNTERFFGVRAPAPSEAVLSR